MTNSRFLSSASDRTSLKTLWLKAKTRRVGVLSSIFKKSASRAMAAPLPRSEPSRWPVSPIHPQGLCWTTRSTGGKNSWRSRLVSSSTSSKTSNSPGTAWNKPSRRNSPLPPPHNLTKQSLAPKNLALPQAGDSAPPFQLKSAPVPNPNS